MLTIVCVRWGEAFSADYVNILYDSVQRNISVPFKFVCATDDMDAYDDGIETVRLPEGMKGWWNKLWLFSKEFQEYCTERILFLDLDTVITGHLDEIAGYSGDFCILRDFYRPDGYGSGLMAWRKGVHEHIWTEWDKAGKPEVEGGDQAWIERVLENADRWQDVFPLQVVSYKVHAEKWPPKDAKIVCFHGFPRPHQCENGWVAQMWRVGGISQPIFSDNPNCTAETFIENVRESVKRPLAWVKAGAAHNKIGVIVGGAPSLKRNYRKIKDRQKRGQIIFALNNAVNALVENGITPDCCIMMDARPENAEFLKNAPDGVHYLINAMCHADVFDALEGKKVSVWHSYIELQEEHHRILNEAAKVNGMEETCILATGNTVGLCAMYLLFYGGFRRLHLYGMDSCYEDGTHHAYEQSLNDGEVTFPVFAAGKEYRCTRWMMKQANDFQDIFRELVVRGCTIMAHGSGLLPDVCRHMNEQWRSQLMQGENTNAKHIQNR